MRPKLASALVTVFLLIMPFSLVLGSTPLFDEQFTISGQGFFDSSKDFRVNLAGGDRISINISVTGDAISLFGIYNSTETYDAILLERRNVTYLNEEWTAPYNDTYDFYIKIYDGTAQVDFIVQKIAGGGGFDPLPIVVIVIVVVAILISAFLLFRMRRQHPLPPPPPPPPPQS